MLRVSKLTDLVHAEENPDLLIMFADPNPDPDPRDNWGLDSVVTMREAPATVDTAFNTGEL